jgi:hypothetical protein
MQYGGTEGIDRGEGRRPARPFRIQTHLEAGREVVQVDGDLTQADLRELLSVIQSVFEFEQTTLVLDLRDARPPGQGLEVFFEEAAAMAHSFGSDLEVQRPSTESS